MSDQEDDQPHGNGQQPQGMRTTTTKTKIKTTTQADIGLLGRCTVAPLIISSISNSRKRCKLKVRCFYLLLHLMCSTSSIFAHLSLTHAGNWNRIARRPNWGAVICQAKCAKLRMSVCVCVCHNKRRMTTHMQQIVINRVTMLLDRYTTQTFCSIEKKNEIDNNNNNIPPAPHEHATFEICMYLLRQQCCWHSAT